MSESSNISRIAYAMLYIVVVCLIVIGISKIFYFLKTGADMNLLDEELAIQDSGNVMYYWNDTDSDYKLSYKEKEKIGRDLSETFQAISRAISTNQNDGLEDYIAPELTDKISKWIDYNRSIDLTDHHVYLDHQWEINFVNKDRTFIELTDKQCVSFHRITVNDSLQRKSLDTSAYKIILLWDQHRWRTKHLINIVREESETTITPLTIVPEFNIGINYIQSNNPWLGFREHIENDEHLQELEKIEQLGINTIRIFLNYHDYGKEYVSQPQLQYLESFLNTCNEYNIKAVVTLFDFYGDYRINDWPHTASHAQQIVSALKDNPSIIAWDLKNEPDLDFGHRGKGDVIDWLDFMTKYIKSVDPNRPITIGWSSIDYVDILEEELDIVSFHYYDEAALLDRKLKNIKSDKPIWITETGVPSYKGIWNLYSNDGQVAFLRDITETCQEVNAQAFIWTLNDFEEVPVEVFGRKPWINAKQKNFGLMDVEGQLKPSGKYIKEFLSNN